MLHIIIAHIPVLGNFLLILLVWKASQSKKEVDYKWVYWFGILIAIVASISYFTGPTTAEWVKTHFVGYSKDLVQNHALWGRIGFTTSILNGLISIMAIANYMQGEKPHKAIPWIVICLVILSTLIYTYTAHLGGLIRRPDLM